MFKNLIRYIADFLKRVPINLFSKYLDFKSKKLIIIILIFVYMLLYYSHFLKNTLQQHITLITRTVLS